jgi:hypothetical protein
MKTHALVLRTDEAIILGGCTGSTQARGLSSCLPWPELSTRLGLSVSLPALFSGGEVPACAQLSAPASISPMTTELGSYQRNPAGPICPHGPSDSGVLAGYRQLGSASG